MTMYNIAQATTNAIVSLQTKRATVLNDVNAGKYATRYNNASDAFAVDVSINMFHSHLERFKLIGELVKPDRTTNRNINDVVSAARFYAYWSHLITRLEGGEDPRTILYELVSNA